ncbi:1-acylglycerol-3-phosphate O-acyltransferase [Conexibacter sp. SYSU D00693]|uniref:1-acylglycerol-3-phosphate O-acyltransferase n=1 Tax=Conexibacter sp. SYSU D00693 TaxID=2812560 RepID=UPI00196BAA0E|nr:1-acylglycerol-3-phosphate O-acyltransferase [Conexibacter sp. SYSU D00693]
MDRSAYLDRARHKGVNPLVYWLVRAVLQPFFHLYFRMSRIGREHIPESGPVIFAANHRSFLDPFVIGTMARRPLYYVAKKELFSHRLAAWFLNSLGAFPIDRGNADGDAMATARAILERGDAVLIFPEGTRTRPGALGRPKRGVGRLALETGAPVVPVAVIGTERVRRGWRIRPHKVRIRAGAPLTFPHVAEPSPELAAAVTSRIWPCVELQWEWLGGLPSVRRAAVVGAGSWGTSVAVALARAGVAVQLGCRTAGQAALLAEGRCNDRYLPGLELPAGVTPVPAEELELAGTDLVVLAVPSRALPEALAAHGAEIPERAGVVVLSKGLVAPMGTLPGAYVAERTRARAVAAFGGPGHANDALVNGAALVVASTDAAFARQLAELLQQAGLSAETSTDAVGVELAGAAKNAAVLAAATASGAGPNAAGAAAGRVFAEVDAYARGRGARAETFAGLAGAGDLVATVVAEGSRNRRAGELLGQGVPADEIQPALGQAAEALDALPLLARALRDGGVSAPCVSGLAEVVEGQRQAGDWVAEVTAPQRRALARAA